MAKSRVNTHKSNVIGKQMNYALRSELKVITDDSTLDHSSLISALKTTHPHSISPLPSFLEEPLGEYNCVMYALDLAARITEPCRPFGRFYADTEFLTELVQKGLLTPSTASQGNIIVWSDDERIKHVGIVSGQGMAISKWGIGNLYEHGFHEVPESYGCNLTFFEPIDGELALGMLSQFLARTL